MEHGLKIFGGAVDRLRPGATFADLRKATIEAAKQLYGADSKDVQKVRESWSAVGVE
jgi:Zn-dependent metalloprotease